MPKTSEFDATFLNARADAVLEFKLQFVFRVGSLKAEL